ncbi:hypothetical protein EXN22_19155 [Pseudomonas tructae]|uniref:Uncharacterized protein n=1 Tax=Pseudomonas tructae TaxID=2518644 RepID=A0A411MLS3_9PSED|nr:hypothetical protein [Pseudomonas tructae]QBF27702.1 hypothetical protein EXN22_19155 [Pseudomonas tructae]
MINPTGTQSVNLQTSTEVASGALNSPGHIVIDIPEELLAGVTGMPTFPVHTVIEIEKEIDDILQQALDHVGADVRIQVESIDRFITAGPVESTNESVPGLSEFSAGRPTQTVEERVEVIVDYLKDVWRSDVLSNLRTSALVNMPSVLALTVARGFLGSAISASVSGTAAVALGATFTALPLLLTAAAMVHHECNGSATPAYRASQLAFFAGAGAILSAALLTDPVSIFSGLAGSAPAVALYCLSRDVLASFHGLGSQTALNLPANLIDSLSYGAMQFAAGAAVVGMEAGLVNSVVGALLNAVIETVEPALNESFSQWMSERPEVQSQPDDSQAYRLGLNVSVPGWERLAARLESTGIPRMTAFSIISAGAATAQTIGAMTGLSDSNQYWLANGVGALLAAYILTPFYQSHALLAEVVVS